MKTLGINISHDSALCIMEDGVITKYLEEGRIARNKYFVPPTGYLIESQPWQSIEQIKDQEFDYVGMVSFDRRDTNFYYGDLTDEEWGDEEKRDQEQHKQALENRWEYEGCRDALLDDLISWDYIKEVEQDYPLLYLDCHYDSQNNRSYGDDDINHGLKEQLGIEHFHFEQNQHHKFHAYGGYHMCPFEKKGEEAMVLVQDGGGSYPLLEEFPIYQEIESIWSISPTEGVQRKWTHLSGMRYEFGKADFKCLNFNVYRKTREGVDYELSMKPSMGFLFSNVCSAVGIEEKGRAAGTVMGLATYGYQSVELLNKESIAQQLQIKSFEYTCKLIEKCLEYGTTNNIILSGGYALNCTNNMQYVLKYPEINFFVDPCSYDAGTSIGMASYLNNDNYREFD